MTIGSAFLLFTASSVADSSPGALDTQVGYASYYSDRFDGKRTASGTVFDNSAMVAAHPTYPFGTMVRVTDLRNQRSTIVRIVDRGPSRAVRRRGVIIDLSQAAAARLALLERGRSRVRVEVLTWGR